MDARKKAEEYRNAQWVQVLRERIANGESVGDFCKRLGVSRNTYFYWQRKIRRLACEQLSTFEPNQRVVVQSVQSGFAEVLVADSDSSLSPALDAETLDTDTLDTKAQKINCTSAFSPCANATHTANLRIEVSGIKITAECTYPTDKLAALLRGLMP